MHIRGTRGISQFFAGLLVLIAFIIVMSSEIVAPLYAVEWQAKNINKTVDVVSAIYDSSTHKLAVTVTVSEEPKVDILATGIKVGDKIYPIYPVILMKGENIVVVADAPDINDCPAELGLLLKVSGIKDVQVIVPVDMVECK